MRIRRTIILTLVLPVCLASWGCSRRSTDGKIPLEFWTYAGGGSTDEVKTFWQAVARGFQRAHPEVSVSVVADIPHGYYMSMLGTRFIGRNPPDVMLMDDVDLGDLAREDLLMPLDDFIAADANYDSSDYPASMVRDGHVMGKRYSVPWYGSYVQITYRSDLLTRVGAKPPRTWDDLLDVCRRLKRDEAMEYPFAMALNGSFWMINWAWQNGAGVVSPDHRRITVDTPEFIESVQFVHDLMHKHRVMSPALAQGTNVQDLWSTGKIAMMLDGAFSVGRYDTLYPRWKGKWALAPLPAGKHDVSFYGGAHLVMSRATEHPDLAWRFMAFATNAENQLMFADMTGNPPGNMKVFDMPAFKQRHPQHTGMRMAIEGGRNNPLAPFFPKVWYDMFRNRVVDVVMGDPHADIALVLRKAARDMQQVADDYWARHPEFSGGSKTR